MTRRPLLASATAAVVLAVVVIGFVLSASSGGAPAKDASTKISGSMVVIGTGGLSWSDISPRTTPTLWSLLRDGASATLGVHTVHANTCPVDGWLTLSAGEQAADAGGEGAVGGLGDSSGAKPPCRALPELATGGKLPHWGVYRAAAGGNRFDPSLGLLGEQVARHGGCVQAVGPGAALGATRASGMVLRYQPYSPSTLQSALAGCPLTLIDVSPVRDPADANPRDETRPTTTRAQQVAAVDARVAAILLAAPAGTDVLVASLADAGVTERLRMVAATGPHFGTGTLESSSTRQPGLVQLTDLTPTILKALGLPTPPSLGGAPLQFVPAQERSDQAAAGRLRALLDYDESSHKVHSLVQPFFYGWGLLQLALYLTVAVLWRRGWGTWAQRQRLLRVTRQVAVIAATIPVSTFLANLLPWWRHSAPLLTVVASVALFSAMISALALLGPWHRRLLGPLVVVSTATVVVLALDVIAGSRLQLSSLMGLQPVIGGRFYGMGNVTFALFATASLLLCIAVGNHLVTLGEPRKAAAAVAAIGAGAVVVDASPWWGSDLGGPTALLPAVVFLVMTILEIRPTWRRLLAGGGGIAGAILLLGLLDWLRPAESRSHLGKFVQTTLDGGAWDVIVRKLEQNITLLFGNPLSLLIPVALVLLVRMLARPDSRGAAKLRLSFAQIPLLRPGLVAITIMWVIGFLLNDSGAAIPAVGASLALPLVIAIALRTLETQNQLDHANDPAPVLTRASRHRR